MQYRLLGRVEVFTDEGRTLSFSASLAWGKR